MFARTARLLLRPGWAEDTPALARVIRGEARSANALDDALVDAETFLAEPRDAILPHFLITLRTDDAPLVIGTCGLIRRASGRVEFACWVAEGHRGRGYATEAGRAVLEIAATLGLAQAEASHFVDHPPSRRLLEKLGFATTGLTAPRYNCGVGADANARLMRIMLRSDQEAGSLAA
ncbi:MAG: GNAT family N-acetyltransferase [Pseudomonadota bacterium]|nr:GNAT family N-acetyltransferase [Pseudomonadota bacterium]